MTTYAKHDFRPRESNPLFCRHCGAMRLNQIHTDHDADVRRERELARRKRDGGSVLSLRIGDQEEWHPADGSGPLIEADGQQYRIVVAQHAGGDDATLIIYARPSSEGAASTPTIPLTISDRIHDLEGRVKVIEEADSVAVEVVKRLDTLEQQVQSLQSVKADVETLLRSPEVRQRVIGEQRAATSPGEAPRSPQEGLETDPGTQEHPKSWKALRTAIELALLDETEGDYREIGVDAVARSVVKVVEGWTDDEVDPLESLRRAFG